MSQKKSGSLPEYLDEIDVEQMIPVPPLRVRRGRGGRYPFDKMKPGSSFFVPIEDGSDAKRVSSSISGAALYWAKRKAGLNPKVGLRGEAKAVKLHEFTCRTVREEGKVGVRCWMVS